MMTLLHLNNVTINFPGTNQPTLKQINYEVQKKDFVVLLGSNGSGKSTLLKLLHRHYHPHAGEINFLNKPITQFPCKTFSKQVAILTQNYADSLFTSLTVYENYLLVKEHTSLKTCHATERAFLKAYLADYNANLANKLDLIIHQLSGGEKQALALALCLLQPPALLLLDEHTSALDPKTSDQIMQLTQKMITEHQITCILATHDLDIALRYGNRVLMLHEGKILKTFDREKKSDLTKNELISSYY